MVCVYRDTGILKFLLLLIRICSHFGKLTSEHLAELILAPLHLVQVVGIPLAGGVVARDLGGVELEVVPELSLLLALGQLVGVEGKLLALRHLGIRTSLGAVFALAQLVEVVNVATALGRREGAALVRALELRLTLALCQLVRVKLEGLALRHLAWAGLRTLLAHD